MYTNDPCGSGLAREEASHCNTNLKASIQSLATAPNADIPLIIAKTPHCLSVLLVDAPPKKSEADSVKLPKGIRPMKILRRYKYDPLDRLAGLQAQEQAFTQRFYQENDLVTELGEEDQQTILRHGEQPLAQRQTLAGATDTLLLATDQAYSVLQTLSATRRERMAYSAYGHRPADSGLSSLLGFNGECLDGITGHYLLGQGKRAFNPVLMRFNSPDELSPFGDGGINSYAYCGGDPINLYDPTGNSPVQFFRPWISKPKHFFRPWTDKPKTLQASSTTIKRANKTSINPTSRSTAATASQPENITSTLISQEMNFEKTLHKTIIKTKRSSTPSKSTVNNRKLVQDGLEYDRYVMKNQDYQPKTTKALLEKWNKYKDQTSNQKTLHQQRYIAENSLKRTELQIKQYNIRRIKDSNPK
ncbi:RHS repeat-associated core domain-containing protein [Pseudomonas fluorescens]|jgi:RHS repeat-associated protein|uniref:RHS repeat-associated core domain-containing protein n=3 Tax=Pseudomonas TaxID=286 RepID=UPI001CD1F33A|nr:RHS repeat-associated core domain-containing protein [Pseudomonas fluorescens]